MKSARQHVSGEYLDPLTRESLDSSSSSEEQRYAVDDLQNAPDLQAARYQQAIKDFQQYQPAQRQHLASPPARHRESFKERSELNAGEQRVESIRPLLRYYHVSKD